MKKIVAFIVSSLIILSSVLPVSAYRVSPNSWTSLFQRADDARYYRIFNPSPSYNMFVPGRDDAGTMNLGNWNMITWNKWRPGSIRIHTVLWPGVGVTNCPQSIIGDSSISYWGTTYGWQPVGWSTTVLANDSWSNRMRYSTPSSNFYQNYTSGELRCDFGANYGY